MRAGLRFEGHGLRIPVADALLEVADIREQRRTGSTKSEDRIFHNRLAAAHCGNEVAVVIQVVAVAQRLLERST